MGDLIVKPSYQFSERDILTVDKLNLLATPVVELALADPVNDQNFFRNGNFYSSYWVTPAGLSCPANAWTTNANYWLCRPQGAAVTSLRSPTVPDIYSLFSDQIVGNTGVTSMEFGQQINGDLSATLRRNVTISGYYFNNTALTVSPVLNFYTANAFNNFSAITLQKTVNLQTGNASVWTYVTATVDLTAMTNVSNGLMVAFQTTGVLTTNVKSINFSRLKLQIGEVATAFVDDVGLFITTPSIDATMLQDGCIARPTLFGPQVIPSTAYINKSVINSAIADGAVDSRTLLPSVSTTLSAGFSQPAVSATVSITVASTVGFYAPEPITIAVGGGYSISSVTDATHMLVTNAGVSGNAAPASSVPTGGAVQQSSAAAANLGYVPVNKAGDSGVGKISQTIDTVVHAASYQEGGLSVSTTSANANNAGYMPCIGFVRPGIMGRALGLDNATSKFKTVDSAGTVGYLLDTVNKVDGAVDIKDASITYQKLATSLINSLVPIGSVLPFAGVGVPGGWLVCDGSAILRTGTYAALFAQLGVYWGNGNGTTTFNIPNFINRVPIGYGSGASWGFGTYGGESAHQISVAEMPAHDHGWSQSPHDHGQHSHTIINSQGTVINIAAGSNQPIVYPSGGVQTGLSTVPPANANISFSAQGGSAAHNNMPPYGVLYYIIKAL